MKVFLPWLEEYVQGDLPPAPELAERLTFAGLEVEGIEQYAGGLEGLVVGRVESCKSHPDADRLSICEVFDGASTRPVVCGAPNVRRGIRAPYAPPGTVLPGGLAVEEREVRGASSAGMLLSADELGLWDDHSGILDLGGRARPGAPLEEVLGGSGEVLDIGATPNRPDALSHVGVARDAAAVLRRRLRLPPLKMREDSRAAASVAKVSIEAPDRCARYVARVIEGVEVGSSPAWLCARLAAAGVRPINNVVDVTNYVLLELGHPLHAFDLDLLRESRIVVRMARGGETLETLDDLRRELDPDDLVIADGKDPVALAGVMGGAGTEVSSSTRRILLESAWFEPTAIRRTARRHGLHTESSHRFERGADPEVPLLAADRAAGLIARLAGGKVLAEPIDVHPRPIASLKVLLRFARTDEVLGFSIPRKEQLAILRRLGFEVVEKSKDRAVLAVPSYRTEMSREIDLIEEIARIFGYDAIPSTLPTRSPADPVEQWASSSEEVVSRLREAASAAGCREVVNYSFLSAEETRSVALEGSEALPESAPLELSNPLSEEQSEMRTTVMVSLLSNLRYNRRFQRNDLKLYEVGRVYLRDESGRIREPERFAALLAGRRNPVGWSVDDAEVDFFDAKGLVEAALDRAGLAAPECRFEPCQDGLPWLHPRSACGVKSVSGLELGWLGEVHPSVLERFDLPRGVFAVELDVAKLAGEARILTEYSGVPRFPAVLRDLAVVVADEVAADRVRRCLEAPLPEAEKLGVRIAGATLFDVYSGPQVGEGKRSLAFAIQYQADDRTLTDSETTGIHEALVGRLESELDARLRAPPTR